MFTNSNPQLETILVIDDNITNLNVITDYLTDEGFEVMAASSGRDGIEKAQRGLPDLILLDVVMPDMDGFQVCATLKADEKTHHIPVIFMTVLDDIDKKVQGFAAGGLDYITKPFQQVEVLARVKSHLALYQLQQMQKDYNTQLEKQVQERTQALQDALSDLKKEIAQRQRHEQEKDKLFELVQLQNEHLQTLTQLLLQSQQQKQQGWVRTMEEQVKEKINWLVTKLTLIQNMVREYPVAANIVTLITTHLEASVEISHQLEQDVGLVTHDLTQSITDLSNPLAGLTEREVDVFTLLVKGQTTGEIAQILSITSRTVYFHRNNIIQKLNVETVSDLVKLAIQQQLVSVDEGHL